MHKARYETLEAILGEEPISMERLRKFCFNGIPDDYGQRPKCWKLLLNYLPLSHSHWEKVLKEQRDNYTQYIRDMVLKRDHGSDDHPLNPNPDSNWTSFFKDNEVLLQIDKDVRRLCPEMSFFQGPTEFPCKLVVSAGSGAERLHHRVQNGILKSVSLTRRGLGANKLSQTSKQDLDNYVILAEEQEAHWEVVERILFIYAKLNPGQGYVQGMNEILGPVYYVFATDPDPAWREHAEVDAFFCFTNLMSEIRDFFIKTLDDSESGITAVMSRLQHSLKAFDPTLWEHLDELELRPQFYSFRWLTLLLSQEFRLPEVIRLWDSLFADKNRFQFLSCVCLAMLALVREELISGDFAHNMKLLQNYPNIDIHRILTKAVSISSLR